MKKAFNEVHKAVLACEDTDGRKRCELFRELPDRRVRAASLAHMLRCSFDSIRTILIITNLSRNLSPSLPSANVLPVDITRASHNTEKTGNSCSTTPGRTTKKGRGSTSMPRRWKKSSVPRSPESQTEPIFQVPRPFQANPPHQHLGRTILH